MIVGDAITSAAHDVGFYPARHHATDADSAAAELEPQRVGETLHGKFGGMISALSGGADESKNTGRIDDVASSAGPDMR